MASGPSEAEVAGSDGISGPASPQSRCPTNSLPDIPATDDFFGPHQAIADALVDIITSDERSRSIGVTGSWGVGKSTVIDLLRQRLEGLSNVRLWVFDAWSHEGDPLRRSFLEDLVKSLAASPSWLEAEDASDRLKALRGSHRHEHTTSTPRVALGGYLLAIAILLIPIGQVLLERAVTAGITLQSTGRIAWLAWLGGLMMFAPLWLPLSVWVPSRLLGLLLTKLNVDPQSQPRPIAAWLKATKDLREVYTPLKGVHEIVTDTDSFEEGEPTSIEFEECFTEVVGEATRAKKDRRLVIVLDNLDRLPSDEAKSIWSTLQPFMQDVSFDWRRQLWLVVTYDRRALRVLAGDNAGESREVGTGGSNALERGAFGSHASFVDKTIGTEFRVPHPVLADWRHYLSKLLDEALPKHPKADFSAIGQLVALYFPRIEDAPTPRQLKKLVNSIGALHRLWGHEIPLVDMAYFALLQRERPEGDPRTPIPPRLATLLSDHAADNLYSLYFGVGRERARHLRLGDPIQDALLSGNVEGIEQILQATEGATPVLQRIVAQGIPEWCQSEQLLFVVLTLSSLDRHSAQLLANQAAQRLSHDFTVEKCDARTDAAVLATLALTREASRREVAERYASQRMTAIVAEAANDNQIDMAERADDLASLVSDSRWPEEAKLAVPDMNFLSRISTAATDARHDRTHPFWSAFDATWSDEALPWFEGRVPVGDEWLTLRAVVRSSAGLELGSLQQRFSTLIQQPRTPDQATATALRCLLELDAAMAIGPVDIAVLSRGLQLAVNHKEPTWTAVVLLLVSAHPEPSLPDALTSARKGMPPDVQTEIGRRLFGLAKDLGSLDRYLGRVLSSPAVVQREIAGFVGSLSKKLRDEEITLPSGALIDNALRLRQPDNLKLLLRSASESVREDIEEELATRPLEVEELAVVSRLLPMTGRTLVREYVLRELPAIPVEGWWSINASHFACDDLAKIVEILSDENGADLQEPLTSLEPVLCELLDRQLRGEGRRPPRLLRQLDTLGPILPDGALPALSALVFKAAIRGRVTLKAWFFRQYGDLLMASDEMRRPGPDVVDAIYIPIVERKTTPVGGLEWLARALREDIGLLTTKGRKHRERFRRVIVRRLEDALSPRQKSAVDSLLISVDGAIK